MRRLRDVSDLDLAALLATFSMQQALAHDAGCGPTMYGAIGALVHEIRLRRAGEPNPGGLFPIALSGDTGAAAEHIGNCCRALDATGFSRAAAYVATAAERELGVAPSAPTLAAAPSGGAVH